MYDIYENMFDVLHCLMKQANTTIRSCLRKLQLMLIVSWLKCYFS